MAYLKGDLKKFITAVIKMQKWAWSGKLFTGVTKGHTYFNKPAAFSCRLV